jgi:DNA-directed RNA polymerase subunit M/transcription elongation factor TFIIS
LLLGGYAMLANVMKSPRCPKCGDMMSLRVIEPERPGFDSRTFECPKCYDTETLVMSISCETDVSEAEVSVASV